VSGVFTGTVDFDGTRLTSMNGSHDIFLCKLDPSGRILWVQQLGSPGNDEGSELEVDAHGRITLSPDIGNGFRLPGGAELTNLGLKNQLVLRMDTDGSLIAYSVAKGSSAVINFAVGIDADGNACVTGSFTDSLSFSGLTIAGEPFGQGRVGDFFVGYLRAGNAVSVERMDSPRPGLTLYPNPARSIVMAEHAHGLVRVFDALGRIVWQGVAEGRISIDLSGSPRGVYWMMNGSAMRTIVLLQ
jgi:hypothetical protein